MKKDNIYKNYQALIKDKDNAVMFYMNKMLNTTCAMFEYKGLPSTIPPFELEKSLQTRGTVGVIRVDGDLYALHNMLSQTLGYILTRPTRRAWTLLL